MVEGADTHAFLALLFTYFQAALRPLTLTFFVLPPLNTVQRRKTAGWLAELSHKEYIGNNTANFKIAYKRCTGMSDALPVPEESFGEGTLRMKIWTIGADVNIPFQIGKQLFAYDTNFQAQWSKTPLTPQDKIAIGRRYTVRGFDGELSLAAERGWYWRNDFGWQFEPGHQLIWAQMRDVFQDNRHNGYWDKLWLVRSLVYVGK